MNLALNNLQGLIYHKTQPTNHFAFSFSNYFQSKWILAQLVGTVEYTNFTLQKGKTPPNEFSGYDTKQSDGEVPVMLRL